MGSKRRFGDRTATMLEFRCVLLQRVSIAVACMISAGTILVAYFDKIAPYASLFVALSNAGLITTYFLARDTKRIRLASWVFLASLLLIILRSTYTYGGIEAPVLTILIMFPFMGFVFGERGLAGLCLILSCSIIILFYFLEAFELIHSQVFYNTKLPRAVVLEIASVLSYLLGQVYHKEQRNHVQALVAMSRLASLGTLASGISHEVNNPLSIILGKVDLLSQKIQRGELEPEKIKAELTDITANAERITHVVRNLESFAREAAAETPSPAHFDRIVAEILDLFRHKFSSRHITMKRFLDSGIRVNCRSAEIGQIIMSLVSNAFDATVNKPAAWVEVVTKRDGQFVNLQVTDSGGPIPEFILGKMMDPFVSTKTSKGATGMSLVLCQAIAEEHGGTLFYDEDCCLTRFVLRLPIFEAT